jgi:hypothetical protein
MELTDKVLINNLCAWPLYFRRLNGVGDVRIPGKAKNFTGVDVAEVQMQIQSGNNLFVGTDGTGNHARVQIVDEKQRKALLGYDMEGADDAVMLTVETVKELFAIRKKEEFQKRLEALVTTPAEKKMVEQLAHEAGGDEVAAWKMEAISKIAETSAL